MTKGSDYLERLKVDRLFNSFTFPLLFVAWEYYETENFIHSLVNVTLEFLWPVSVTCASFLNASPY